MGARRVHEIKELCYIAEPHDGIITSVGPQHLETFGSIENVLNTKFELADCVKAKG
jgi:UDP-N-acetylmuramoyl-tripeptide--D-alanyl-D-alanine ligase